MLVVSIEELRNFKYFEESLFATPLNRYRSITIVIWCQK